MVKTMAIWFPMILTSLVPIGCGEESQPAKAAQASWVQGASFDVAVVPQAIEPAPSKSIFVPEETKPEPPVAPAVSALPVTPPPLPSPTAVVSSDPPPPAPKAAATEPKKEQANEPPMALSFVRLAGFRYFAPANRPKPGEAPAKSPIPASVRALDGMKVAIEGYMIPVDLQRGKVVTFLLSRSAFGCCYADSPQITEVIKVTSADGKPMSYLPMPRVTGTLEVGEEYDSEGYIDSIYRIRADAVAASPER